MRGLCIRIWFVFGLVGFLPHYNNTLAQLYWCRPLCLVDGTQFIAEWKEHLPSYANRVIIYSRVLTIFVLLLLHPISIHLSSSSSMAWGIIFAEGFISILCWDMDTHMPMRIHTHRVIFVNQKKKSNLLKQRLNNWCCVKKRDEIIIGGWLLEEHQTQSWRLAGWAKRARPKCIWDRFPVKSAWRVQS